MMQHNDIENIYKSSLNDYEADVSAGVWEKISQKLGNASAEGQSAGNVPAGSASRWNLGIISASGVAIVGLVAGLYFINMPEKKAINTDIQNEISDQNGPITTGQPDKIGSHEQLSIPEQINSKNEAKPLSENLLVARQEPSSANYEKFSTNDDVMPLPAQMGKLSAKGSANLDARTSAPESVTGRGTSLTAPPVNHENINEPAMDLHKSNHFKLNYPNVITPNGDDKNEIFIVDTENILSLSVTVFSMSGRMIHQWNSLYGFWDGNYNNGEKAPDGKYLVNIFAVRNDGEVIHRSATLELIR